MNMLCINTAFSNTYIAVQNGKEITYKSMDSSLKQSENVLGAIDECLNTAKKTLQNIDVISCVIGPGSFTGIRIGASIAKGFCFALPHIQKVEINSLDLLAFTFAKNMQQSTDFWVVLNALSGNLFACKYDKNGEKIQEPCLVFGEELAQITGTIVGLKDEQLSLCNHFVNFSCEDLLKYSQIQVQNSSFAEDFVPLYLRKSQAEAELEKKE